LTLSTANFFCNDVKRGGIWMEIHNVNNVCKYCAFPFKSIRYSHKKEKRAQQGSVRWTDRNWTSVSPIPSINVRLSPKTPPELCSKSFLAWLY
jgi:hypothetical protein